MRLAGDAVPIRLADRTVCAPPRVISPGDLLGVVQNDRQLFLPDMRSSIDLNLFGEDLTPPDDDLYARIFEAGADRRNYPPDWLRIDLIAPSYAIARTEPLNERLRGFDSEPSLDRGFLSHRRNADCAGERTGAGCCIAIELGDECRQTTLKHGHEADPDVVLQCGTARCWVRTPLKSDGIDYQYDFPSAWLERWAPLHSLVRARVAAFATDRSCLL